MIHEAASDASHATAAAMSSTVPSRRMGIWSRKSSRMEASDTSGPDISVGTSPGRTALTRMPAAPSSSAALRTSMSTPALVAQYGAWKRLDRTEFTDEIAMNAPPPFAASRGVACLSARNVPVRLVSMTRCHACSGTCEMGAIQPVPAAATIVRRWPLRSLRSIIVATASSSPTSQTAVERRSLSRPSAASCSRSALRPAMVTCAPPARNRAAHASPMPLPPPVMSTLPVVALTCAARSDHSGLPLM